MSSYARLVALVVIAVALAASHWKVYVAGQNKITADWQAERITQLRQLEKDTQKARDIENQRTDILTEKINERTKKLQQTNADLAAARGDAAGLRRDIYTLDRSAATESLAACTARAATARAVFAECTEAHTDLAGKADGHAADAVMLRDGWPK